jgi:branched-subunit amino acid transport protein AzlD
VCLEVLASRRKKMLNIKEVLIASFATGLAVFLMRALPFILFAKTKPPKFLYFIENYIPPLILSILLIYSIKETTIIIPSANLITNYLPSLLCITIAILLHLYKKNAMISIFASTIIYMVLIRI